MGPLDRFGGVDVLVSNAGGPPRGVFEDFEDDAWFDAFELNVMSAVRLVREALPHMRGRGGGRILFILSSSVREPIDDLLLSNVMRPAVAGLAKSLSRALGEENILVNVVIPGVIKTERAMGGRKSAAKRLGITFEESVARVEREVPLGRPGRARGVRRDGGVSRLPGGELHLRRRVRRRRRETESDLMVRGYPL